MLSLGPGAQQSPPWVGPTRNPDGNIGKGLRVLSRKGLGRRRLPSAVPLGISKVWETQVTGPEGMPLAFLWEGQNFQSRLLGDLNGKNSFPPLPVFLFLYAFTYHNNSRGMMPKQICSKVWLLTICVALGKWLKTHLKWGSWFLPRPLLPSVFTSQRKEPSVRGSDLLLI